MRFLGLELAGSVPDARTVWAFREALKQHQLMDALFERTQSELGVELKSGQIIDATFVPVPIQRNRPDHPTLSRTGNDTYSLCSSHDGYPLKRFQSAWS